VAKEQSRQVKPGFTIIFEVRAFLKTFQAFLKWFCLDDDPDFIV